MVARYQASNYNGHIRRNSPKLTLHRIKDTILMGRRLYTYDDLWEMYHSEVNHGKRLMLELKALSDEYKKLEKVWEGKNDS